jgi:hypothetical protein
MYSGIPGMPPMLGGGGGAEAANRAKEREDAQAEKDALTARLVMYKISLLHTCI